MLSGPALLRAVLGDPNTFNVSDLMSAISLPVQGNIYMYVCMYIHIYICMGYLWGKKFIGKCSHIFIYI